MTGLLIGGAAVAVVVVGLYALATVAADRSALVQWAAAQTPLTMSGIMAVAIAAFAVSSYVALRRATA